MSLGAIVVMGNKQEDSSSASRPEPSALLSRPLPYVDVLGRSAAERIIERFVRADVDTVTVLQQRDGSEIPKPSFTAFENVDFQLSNDPNPALYQKLKEYSQNGIEHSFLLIGNLYTETDLLDLFYFHREARQTATRTINREGGLNLWVVDCSKAQQSNLKDLLAQPKTAGSSYFIREYVNRLAHPRDLRRFASDLLRGRCSARRFGREVKRGIWVEEGAEVHRRARIVAPAYIGRESKIMADTLITRCSTVERDCCVDYGTVIEDSSILQNTEIGICLDVCHAVANGNKLLNLERDVVIEISDSTVLRSNRPAQKQVKDWKWARNVLTFNHRKPTTVADLQPATSAPK